MNLSVNVPAWLRQELQKMADASGLPFADYVRGVLADAIAAKSTVDMQTAYVEKKKIIRYKVERAGANFRVAITSTGLQISGNAISSTPVGSAARHVVEADVVTVLKGHAHQQAGGTVPPASPIAKPGRGTGRHSGLKSRKQSQGPK